MDKLMDRPPQHLIASAACAQNDLALGIASTDKDMSRLDRHALDFVEGRAFFVIVRHLKVLCPARQEFIGQRVLHAMRQVRDTRARALGRVLHKADVVRTNGWLRSRPEDL